MELLLNALIAPNNLEQENTMGTRSLTMVIDHDGEIKVAQFGQLNGYPSGVGASVLRFLKNKELVEKLKSKLPIVRFLDESGGFDEIYNNNKHNPEWKQWFETYGKNNLAADVLVNVANSEDSEIVLLNREYAAKTDGWVEFSYVINFKDNTLGVYEHIDQPPLKVYSLDELPEEDDFIEELE